MITSSRFFARFCMAMVVGVAACSPDLFDEPIPYVPFPDIVLSLGLPENAALQTNGGFRVLTSAQGGVQGIIVYRVSSTQFIAYERNCSFTPNEACVTVEAHSSGLFMIDPCCNSTFDFATGNPTGGPAWRPLRQYETFFSGGQLTITDTAID